MSEANDHPRADASTSNVGDPITSQRDVPRLELIDRLRAVSVFSRCSQSQLRRLTSIVRQIGVEDGDVICREEELSREFHVVLEGRVRLSAHGRTVYVSKPGEFFGELAMLAATPRMLSAVATGSGLIGVIEANDFEDLLIDVPVFARSVLYGMATHMWVALDAMRTFIERPTQADRPAR